MLKRWAGLPRSTRWLLAAIAAVVLAVAVAWVLFVPAADWLAHHDVGSVKGPLHETALDNARGRLLTLGAGLFAAGALVFTARNFTLSRRTLDVTEQGQVTDRYTKAIEQLGSDKLDVRIGGIYALERIARDSERDHPTVMEVLTAFIREHSDKGRPRSEPDSAEPERSTLPDVQAALTAVGRRVVERDIRPLDLRGAILPDADLTHADLNSANLTGADLTGAILAFADLRGAILGDAVLTNARFDFAHLTNAHLRFAHLDGANFNGANLSGANLGGAHLDRANLNGANLTLANLTEARLTRAKLVNADLTDAFLSDVLLTDAFLIKANLTDANLTDADLTRANLSGAILTDADLTDADLTDAILTDANLTRARWPEDAPIPEGWRLDTGSSRLERTDTDSGPAEAN